MSSVDRLKEYSNPKAGPQGAGRDQKNIDYWSKRASENSNTATRATDADMKLHDTGKTIKVRDTEMSPRAARKIDAAMAGKGDLNHVGESDYMKSVRRNG